MKKLEIMDNIKVKKSDSSIMTFNKIIIWICLMIAGFIIFPVYIGLICAFLVPFSIIAPFVMFYRHHRQNKLIKAAKYLKDENYITEKGV